MKNVKILDHPIELRTFYLTLGVPLALSILSIFIIPALVRFIYLVASIDSLCHSLAGSLHQPIDSA
jgi:hypothetical protein